MAFGPNAKVRTSSDVLSLVPFSSSSSYRIPTWRQGRFLAYALPHRGRGGQVGLWPRGCKLSTKVGTSYVSLNTLKMDLTTLKKMSNALKSILNTSGIMTSILNTSDRRSKKLKGQEHNALKIPRVVHNSPSLDRIIQCVTTFQGDHEHALSTGD